MKLLVNYFCFMFFCLLFSLKSFGQYYTPSEIENVNSTHSAFEGDLYLDTINKEYFIGLTTGKLAQLSYDSNEVIGELLDNMLDETDLISNSAVNTVTQKSVKTYIDSLFGLSGNEAIFPIYAEEGGGLNVDGSNQYSFGNGNTTSTGIIIPQTCTLFAVGLAVNSGSAEVAVVKNGATTLASSGLASGGIASSSIKLLSTPIVFNQGDVLNFETIISNSGNAGRAVAWLRIQSKTPSFFRFNGAGLPIVSLGTDGDEYLNNSNGDLYFKENGTWVFKLNLKGPAGSVSVRAFIQVTNTLSGNINNGITNFTWINTNSSKIISNDLSKYTVDSDGITFINGGNYRVTLYQNQVGFGPDRTNSGVQLLLDGAAVGPLSANAYMRNTNNHNRATASISYIVSASSGQKLGFNNEQLTSISTLVTCPLDGLILTIEEM